MILSILLVFLGIFFILKNQYMLPFKSNFLKRVPYQFLFPYENVIGVTVLILSFFSFFSQNLFEGFFVFSGLIGSILLFLSGLNLSLFIFDYILLSKDLEYSDLLKNKIRASIKGSELYLGILNLIFGVSILIIETLI